MSDDDKDKKPILKAIGEAMTAPISKAVKPENVVTERLARLSDKKIRSRLRGRRGDIVCAYTMDPLPQHIVEQLDSCARLLAEGKRDAEVVAALKQEFGIGTARSYFLLTELYRYWAESEHQPGFKDIERRKAIEVRKALFRELWVLAQDETKSDSARVKYYELVDRVLNSLARIQGIEAPMKMDLRSLHADVSSRLDLFQALTGNVDEAKLPPRNDGFPAPP